MAHGRVGREPAPVRQDHGPVGSRPAVGLEIGPCLKPGSVRGCQNRPGTAVQASSNRPAGREAEASPGLRPALARSRPP
ncbi:hypothetical protein NL676_005672 [Syzygium grande]|nr:hypothetical protein NL676_005672 [Syzygium grande]